MRLHKSQFLISDSLQTFLNTQSECMETWAKDDWRPRLARVNTHSQLFTNQIKLGVKVWLLQINLLCQGRPSAALSDGPVYNRLTDTQVVVAGNINRLLTLPSTQRDKTLMGELEKHTVSLVAFLVTPSRYG